MITDKMSPRKRSAVRMNLSCSTAMLITLELRVSYALHPTRCLIFKDWNAREDTTWAFWLLTNAGTSLGRKTVPRPRPHRRGSTGRVRLGGRARGLVVHASSRAALSIAALSTKDRPPKRHPSSSSTGAIRQVRIAHEASQTSRTHIVDTRLPLAYIPRAKPTVLIGANRDG